MIFDAEVTPLQNTIKVVYPSDKDLPRYFHFYNLVSEDLYYSIIFKKCYKFVFLGATLYKLYK